MEIVEIIERSSATKNMRINTSYYQQSLLIEASAKENTFSKNDLLAMDAIAD